MSKWLVIGASSFTGQRFCQFLRARNEDVQEASLRHSEALEMLLQRPPADYVVNFAALNVVPPSWEHPVDYAMVNLVDQIDLWDALRRMMPKKYVHVSTPEVYGSTAGWIDEDAAMNPSTPYAATRASAEMMLRCYHKRYGLPVVFTRAANCYGPGQQLYRLIPKLAASILHGKLFPLEGGGRSHRTFVHVDDVCRATHIAAIRGEPGQAYHISSPSLLAISAIASAVCSMMGVQPADVIVETPERPGKDGAYMLRSERMRDLGWHDEIGIMAGVREVIAWVNREWETLKGQSLEYEFRP